MKKLMKIHKLIWFAETVQEAWTQCGDEPVKVSLFSQTTSFFLAHCKLSTFFSPNISIESMNEIMNEKWWTEMSNVINSDIGKQSKEYHHQWSSVLITRAHHDIAQWFSERGLQSLPTQVATNAHRLAGNEHFPPALRALAAAAICFSRRRQRWPPRRLTTSRRQSST